MTSRSSTRRQRAWTAFAATVVAISGSVRCKQVWKYTISPNSLISYISKVVSKTRLLTTLEIRASQRRARRGDSLRVHGPRDVVGPPKAAPRPAIVVVTLSPSRGLGSAFARQTSASFTHPTHAKRGHGRLCGAR